MKQKYFGTDGIRGRVGEEPMTVEFVKRIGWSIGKALGKNSAKVIIGQDTRESGEAFAQALAEGLAMNGVDSILAGVIPTPVVAFLTRKYQADAGIVISASHNPYYDNGVKVFSRNGFKIPDEMEFRIEAFLEEDLPEASQPVTGKISSLKEVKDSYVAFCKELFTEKNPLKDLHIILDCANGATYSIAPEVFMALGAQVESIHCTPNGININEQCGSTSPADLRQSVLDKKADLGIAFDGDGDRVMMVDHLGELLDGDELLLIIVDYLQQKNELKGGVVGTVMTNMGFELSLKSRHMEFLRAKVGDKFVVEALQEKGWQLGGESSGHILHLGLTTTGDGIISALLVLKALCYSKKSLHEAKKLMVKCPQVMINVKTRQKETLLQNSEIKTAIASAEAALQGRGRILLRPSGTEPLVRVMVEGENAEQVKSLAEHLVDVVKNCE